MLILHISDIHFKSPECLSPDTDPDLPIRTRMMRDLREQISTLGPVGAILIGGDIAFKAAKEEYDTARQWIRQLEAISGCQKSRIFVVPGNHDVDRKMIRDSEPIQNVQHAIASTAKSQREDKFRRQIYDKESGQTLFKPHAAYNNFAAPLGCQIWPDKPFWRQDIELNGGVTLRVYGLTSTLLSGQNGADDVPRDLYLSPLQTVLNPIPNTANLVLVHHPIDWLEDGEAVDDALTARAAFHLFGHKHKQRAILEANFVRIGAGAVNPSRSETPYEPGYNLINLDVAGEGDERHIKVELHQRQLQKSPELFVPILTSSGEKVFRSTIRVPVTVPIPEFVRETAPEESDQTVPPRIELDSAVNDDAEAAMGEENNRDLLHRFWCLTSSKRREIVQKLGLLEEGEMRLPEPERYGRALIRAGERDMLSEIATLVTTLEN